MTVQDSVHTVTVPRQAGPADSPSPTSTASPDTAPAPLLGRDRPLTADERQFLVALVAIFVVLGSLIVAGLLLAQYVWS